MDSASDGAGQGQGDLKSVGRKITRSEANRSRWRSVAAFVAAVCVLAAIAIAVRFSPLGLPKYGTPDSGLVTLVASMDAHWGKGLSPRVGASIVVKSLELQGGLAGIRFASGANVMRAGIMNPTLGTLPLMA